MRCEHKLHAIDHSFHTLTHTIMYYIFMFSDIMKPKRNIPAIFSLSLFFHAVNRHESPEQRFAHSTSERVVVAVARGRKEVEARKGKFKLFYISLRASAYAGQTRVRLIRAHVMIFLFS